MALKLYQSLRNVCTSVSNNTLSCLAGTSTCSNGFHTSTIASAIYEPDDISFVPDIPEYETLNICMRGYDFVVLESFSKYVHNLTTSLSLDVTMIPVPARTSNVQVYKSFSTNIQDQYQLSLYERTVQVNEVPSTKLPLLLDVLQQHTPAGVGLKVQEPDPEEEEFRYVPDLAMLELQAQKESIDKVKEERRKK